jgi:sugar (pentulose or hexulose) kinase
VTGVDLLVGIDVGTTRVKATAVDRSGRVRGEGDRPTPWRHEGGRADVDPIALARLAQAVAADAAVAAVGCGPRVIGIGVTGMAETGVLVDADDRPLAPAIAWHDPRGDVETIARQLGAEAFQETTGLPLTVMPSLSKLLWLRQNRPETRAATRFYSIAEWVVRRMGGAAVTELSLASRTGLLELRRARPWDAAIELLGFSPLLPDLVVAGAPAGRAAGDVPEVLRGAVLTVAGHDHQTASYGVGAATDGALFDSLGTAEALVRNVRAPLSAQHIRHLVERGMSVGWGVIADHLCVLAGIPTGLTLSRIASLVGAATPEERTRLGEEALAAPAGNSVLRLVDAGYAEVGIAGVTDDVTPALLWQAAIDNLVGQADEALSRIDAVAGRHRTVVVAGGWLHNPAVLAAKRRQYPGMRMSEISEAGAYGAALLAAAAAGVPLRASGGAVPADAAPRSPRSARFTTER